MGQSNSYKIDSFKLKSPGIESQLKFNQESIEEEQQEITKMSICEQNNLLLFTNKKFFHFNKEENQLQNIPVDQCEFKNFQECKVIAPIQGRSVLQAKYEIRTLGQEKFIEKWKLD